MEKGDTHKGTLRREVLEEADVEIEVLSRIGLMHLKHTTPKPKDYPYSYPDFLWPIYAASFAGWRLDAKDINFLFKVEVHYVIFNCEIF